MPPAGPCWQRSGSARRVCCAATSRSTGHGATTCWWPSPSMRCRGRWRRRWSGVGTPPGPDREWKREEDWAEEPVDGVYADADADQEQDEDVEDSDDSEDVEPRSPVVMKVADTGDDESAEPDYLDVDVVDEDSGALPVGASAREAEPALVPVDD